MMAKFDRTLLIPLLLFFGNSFMVSSMTDPLDLSALQSLYESLDSPTQLIGWKLVGGDPCGGQPWTGVLCAGKSVVSINIKGLELGGLLGSELASLLALKELDVSYNNIGGKIPDSLPPNATYIDLAVNNFCYSIPYPKPSLKALTYLNVSHNSLSGPIGNLFTGMHSLEQLDLSFNHLTGDLPSSFGSLTNLHTLHLQNNELTGSVFLLANLPLSVLCLQNNHFSGYVPIQFETIKDLRIEGNMLQPVFESPPALLNGSTESPRSSADENVSHDAKITPSLGIPLVEGRNYHNKRMSPGAVAGITCAVLLVALIAAAVLIQIHKSSKCKLERSKTSYKSLHTIPISAPKVMMRVTIEVTIEWRQNRFHHKKNYLLKPPDACTVNLDQPLAISRLPSAYNVGPERVSGKKSFTQVSRKAISLKIFSASELLDATNNYSEEYVIGEGSLARVYKAEFPDGQILAVKKLNMVALTVYEENNFLDVVQNLVRLSHTNISKLLGYSVDQGEHILVYDYAKNGSLDDLLFSSSGTHNAPSWKARVTIALGVAHALEYMHCVCSPPMAHGNLKASNILFDAELTPLVSDGGLTVLGCLFDTNRKDSVSSNGYAAPELNLPGADMCKSDIYSYGIVLLELLTRRRAFDSSKEEGEQLLVKWASSRLHDFSSLEGMVDPEIKGTIPSNILSRFADIILLCIQPSPVFRSPVTVIAENLVSLLQKMAHPHRHTNKKRGSVDFTDVYEGSDLSFVTAVDYLDGPSFSKSSD